MYCFYSNFLSAFRQVAIFDKKLQGISFPQGAILVLFVCCEIYSIIYIVSVEKTLVFWG
jgi:hypothetical protein